MMTNKHEQSREEWEQELVKRQHNVTRNYPEGLPRLSIDGPPWIVSLVRFVGGILLVTLGVRVFPSTLSAVAAIPVLAIAAGLYLANTGIRWKIPRK